MTLRIYVGPSLPQGRLQRFTVFRDGFTPYMQALIAEYPEIERLTVPVMKFGQSLNDIDRRGSALNTVYTQFSLNLKGGAAATEN